MCCLTVSCCSFSTLYYYCRVFFIKSISAVTVNFGSSSVDKWCSGLAVIDFLITRHCALQFSSLVLRQTRPHPSAAACLCVSAGLRCHPPPSLCLYSLLHSYSCLQLLCKPSSFLHTHHVFSSSHTLLSSSPSPGCLFPPFPFVCP